MKSKKQILETPCTVWGNKESNKRYVWPLWYVLKKVPHFDENEPRINRLRTVGGDAMLEIKRGLPVWMPGIWDRKTKDGLQTFSGFMQFDVDHVDDPEAIKLYLAGIASVAMVSVSVSGHGVYGWVSIPDDAKDEHRYQAYFRAFSAHLNQFGISVDERTININRMRFISVDDAPYIADKCQLWTEAVEVAPPPSPFTMSEMTPPSPSYTSTASRPIDPSRKQYGYAQRLSFCQTLTDQAVARNIDPCPTSRLWRLAGLSLAGDFGEDARQMFLDLSAIWESQHGPQKDDPNVIFDWCISQSPRWQGGSFKFQGILRDAGISVK